MKICIAGGPKTGKTTLAHQLGTHADKTCLHTDDLAKLVDWHGESLACAKQFDHSGEDWINEGVVIPRALRKWLVAHPIGKPCDTVIWLETPHGTLTKGQESMAKGCLKVFKEIEPELIRRKVKIERR